MKYRAQVDNTNLQAYLLKAMEVIMLVLVSILPK